MKLETFSLVVDVFGNLYFTILGHTESFVKSIL
jgi:hypothetical protein